MVSQAHIRSLGFESGKFTLRYNFLRKISWWWVSSTSYLDKNDTKIGDVYTNINKLYITDDGIVYNVTEQEFEDISQNN